MLLKTYDVSISKIQSASEIIFEKESDNDKLRNITRKNPW